MCSILRFLKKTKVQRLRMRFSWNVMFFGDFRNSTIQLCYFVTDDMRISAYVIKTEYRKDMTLFICF